MRAAFLVWNQFQVAHFVEMARHFDEPDFIFIDRDTRAIKNFDLSWLTPYGAYARFLKEEDVQYLDGQYDVLLTQFTPKLLQAFTKTKIVMCQYSLAKPKTAYNSRWFLADLGLVYGEFSNQIISTMCPTAMTGNARFDPLFEDRLDPETLQKIKDRLNPQKKTVLFLPTWGDLNSSMVFKEAILNLSEKYNVIFQPHHLSKLREDNPIKFENPDIISSQSFEPSLDLGPYFMSVADIVLSDMSGAIFDALYCQRPVVLLGMGNDYSNHKKAEPSSLEIAEQRMIGPLVTETDKLILTVEEVLKNKPFKMQNDTLASKCFVQRGGCGKRSADSIKFFLANMPDSPPLQLYAGDQIKSMSFAKHTHINLGKKKKSKVLSPVKKASLPIKLATLYLQTVINILPRKWGAFYLLGLAYIAEKLATKKVAEQLITWASDLDAYQANLIMGDIALKHDKRGLAVQLYKKAAPHSRRALRQYSKISHRIGDFFETGLALELWTKQTTANKSQTFLQFTSAASKLRFSRHAWRKSVLELREYLLSRTINTDKKVTANRLHEMGFLSTALEIAEQYPEKEGILEHPKVASTQLARLIEIAAENEILDHPSSICITDKSLATVTLGKLSSNKVAEISILLSLSRKEADISDGIRNSESIFTCNCVNALLSLGFNVLPRMQSGLRGAIPITGKYPSLTWHSHGSVTPQQLHMKVGTFNGHIFLDDKGFGGWASIADKKIEDLTESVSEKEADAHWQYLYESHVTNGLSKYTQSKEAPPASNDFIFFPMQVLDDVVAELSYINCLDLLHTLAAWAKKTGSTVVVKRHPRCTFKTVQDALQRYSSEGAIILSDASIHELIPKAACIITVNSGVGAEALLYLKPVITTGGTDYACATTQVKNPEELLTLLDSKIWKKHSDIEIKKFLWVYTKKVMPHHTDTEAIYERLQELLIPGEAASSVHLKRA